MINENTPYSLRTKYKKVAATFFLFTLLVLLTSCERDTVLAISTDNPPSFSLSGSGRMLSLRVYGPQLRDMPGEAANWWWLIAPEDEVFNVKRIEELSPIVYGKVPPGYKQIFPEQGTPPNLIEGQKYQVWVETLDANGAREYFIITDGKADKVLNGT